MKSPNITTDFLRKVAEDALKREQFGLIIWRDWDEWKYKSRFVVPGTDIYDATCMSVQDSKPIILSMSPFCSFLVTSVEWSPHMLDTPKTALAVSTRDVVYSANFCAEVAKYCNTAGLFGPISMISSGRLSPIYVNPSI